MHTIPHPIAIHTCRLHTKKAKKKPTIGGKGEERERKEREESLALEPKIQGWLASAGLPCAMR